MADIPRILGRLLPTFRRDSPGDSLSPAERKVWDAYPTGAWVELDGEPVRAELIASLLLGVRDAAPGQVPAVRLRGARVTGTLTILGGSIGCELSLDRCELEGRPDFTESTTKTIRIVNSRMPGFCGGGVRMDGHLSLSGSEISGEVRLPRAQINGGLRMLGTTVRNLGEWAIFSGSLVVEAGAFLDNADISGGVRLVGARMNGGLFLRGTTLRNPGGDALLADNLIVEDVMECTEGFTAEGAIGLRGARVNGTLSFRDGELQGDLRCAFLEARELVLHFATPIEGTVNLVYSKIGIIFDDPAVWPERLRLNGAVYEALRGNGIEDRVRWVARDPQGFRPQPYEQLAAWYIRDGNEELARRTQLAKLRARRATLRPGGRFWGRVLDVTVGYGYRPWLACVWFALLLTAGTVTFTLVEPRPIKPAESPRFNAFAYTLDLLIPINAFGQRGAFDPVGWTPWLAYALIASGWILATALITGAARVLRRG
ncbi:hypothetical protein [Rhizohabitans arisaemae]|uniref:hypothetical protein n=1 Tax=Rhizohabitans arisaemae TaxID=2720610 RepID=UPI0024B2213C|nr:hypothetical protein [Rhizohabitans arisaemae]